MIDVHCHLNFHAFKDDCDAVIKRAKEAGVTKIVNVGTKLDSSRHAVQLANEYEDLWAIVGVHPHHADKVNEKTKPVILGNEVKPESDSGQARMTTEDVLDGDNLLPLDWIDQLEEIALHPKVIGIGECGMDYFSYQSNGIVDPKLQREVFEAQIVLAHKLKLPLQIHHRQVGQELIDILKHHKNLLLPVPGMFHCFAGSKEFLKQALDLGFFIGFDGNSTYSGLPKGETVELREHMAYTPLERIVTETDSPYLTPIPHRGTRNEPAYVVLVGKYIAEIKQLPFETVLAQTTKNIYTVFTKLDSK